MPSGFRGGGGLFGLGSKGPPGRICGYSVGVLSFVLFLSPHPLIISIVPITISAVRAMVILRLYFIVAPHILLGLLTRSTKFVLNPLIKI